MGRGHRPRRGLRPPPPHAGQGSRPGGLALGRPEPHTPAEMVKNVLCDVDHVLVMTVNPGFGGQAYIPTMLDKIRTIRGWIVEGGYDVDIEVDGGVKADWTIAQCCDAGANCFCRQRHVRLPT